MRFAKRRKNSAKERREKDVATEETETAEEIVVREAAMEIVTETEVNVAKEATIEIEARQFQRQQIRELDL